MVSVTSPDAAMAMMVLTGNLDAILIATVHDPKKKFFIMVIWFAVSSGRISTGVSNIPFQRTRVRLAGRFGISVVRYSLQDLSISVDVFVSC